MEEIWLVTRKTEYYADVLESWSLDVIKELIMETLHPRLFTDDMTEESKQIIIGLHDMAHDEMDEWAVVDVIEFCNWIMALQHNSMLDPNARTGLRDLIFEPGVFCEN